jgi:DNA-binding transcriptional LysR family regulator
MAFSRFTIRQLETFAAVAELRSFTDAAGRLGLSPSAVSQLVAELESALGINLFERTTRKVALSAAGQQFLGSATAVLKHTALAESMASDIRSRAAGVVRVAASQVIASAILPQAITAFRQLHPKVIVRIRDSSVDNIVHAVANADVDLAIGPDRVVGDDIARTTLFESPWVLWCSSQHPLARRKTIRWHELRKYDLVAAGRDHEKSVARMHASEPDEERITPIEIVDNITTALGLATQGTTATLAPAYVGAIGKPFGLLMKRVVGPEIMRQVCLYESRARVGSPASEGFKLHIIDWLTGRKDLGNSSKKLHRR